MANLLSTLKGSARKLLLTVPSIKNRIDYHNSSLLRLAETESRLKSVLFTAGYEPGHYYSTIPDLTEVKQNEDVIWGDKNLDNVDLNTEKQWSLLENLKLYYNDYLYNKPGINLSSLRYQKEGAWYRHSDCVFLHSVLMHFKPKKIIEIGSGHSSALMLDVNEHYFKNEIKFTFVEPFPEERLLKIMSDEDHSRHEIIRKFAQEVPIEKFKILEENDVLFIDSTHVSKVGSDVNYLLFEALPNLNSGVLIHIHDIFYPFEMPKHWVQENRWFWNENYLLHAFLINNHDFEIVAFNSYTLKLNKEWFAKEMPECLVGSEDTGSIWLRKV
jgi:hypothetical protein